MTSFYIFLPSNSDKENKIGNFKVKLPETIRLNGEWEMSMREFNYTRSWYNIGNADDAHINIINFPTAPSQIDLTIPLNNYDTPQQLMNAITFTISQYFLKTYPNIDQRIKRASNKTKKNKVSAKVNSSKTPKSISAATTNLNSATTVIHNNNTKTRNTTSAKISNSNSSEIKQNTAKASNSTSKKAKQSTRTTELTADERVSISAKSATSKKSKNNKTKAPNTTNNVESTSDRQISQNKTHISKFKAKKIKKPNFNLHFESIFGKSVFKNYEDLFYLVTSDKIGYMLGFEHGRLNYMSEYLDGSEYTVAPYPPDMNAGMYALMVHCDLVAPQLVGNTYANLLRMVPVVGRFNETITNIYDDEQYVPVMQKTFDSIEININDDTGKLVNFLYGRTFVTLHFRKQRKWVV